MFSIYKKELHSFFCTPFAYIISALFMLLFTLSINNGITYLTSQTLQFTFADVFATNTFYFTFLVPALTMRCFSDERKFGTEVLLLTSPVKIFQIVLAKFSALITVFFVMLGCSSIYPIVTSMHGKVIIPSLIAVYIGFFLWGVMCIAVGMLFSSFTENAIIAAVLGEAAMLALTYINYLATSDFIREHPVLKSIIDVFASEEKFNYFAQGLIRVSDVVFFLTVIFVFLAWTIISLEARRWKKG